jgi:UDP-N-acetylglucosamine 2-epimerase
MTILHPEELSMRSPDPSTKTRLISVVGARPQFVKVAPLCRAIEEHNQQFPEARIEHQIIHTGQHYDRELADLFFHQMKIPAPRYNLGAGSGSHGTQLARMLARMEPILCSQQPDCMIVYGDTNSTLAGALLAARLKLPLAHVEAGCRSGQISQPEEQNRIVADNLSQLLLASSEKNQANLHREGIGVPDDPLRRRVLVVGDILLDALLQNTAIAEQDAQLHLDHFGVKSKSYYLLTLHRAENTDHLDRLRGIVEGASGLQAPVVFPVHPRTRKILSQAGIPLNGNLLPLEPQGYLQMLTLQRHALKILTDSGGIQKEAFYLGVPCITLRERTEWTETVEAGANRLVPAEPAAIRAAASEEFELRKDYQPYGDGTTAQRIVAELAHVAH